MNKILLTLTILFSYFSEWSIAQTDQYIWISGYVVDSATLSPVPYANIASFSQRQLYAADSKGHFYIQLPRQDSIKIVVIGYGTKVFRLDAFDENADDVFIFPLSRTSIMLKNIDINLKRGFIENAPASSMSLMENLHLPSDIIPYDKSKDLIPASYKPIFKYKPPVAAFFFHPVSYVSYFTTKSEKSKRKMVKVLKEEKSRHLMSRNLIKEVSGLDGDSLNEFIIFCNKNIKLLPEETIFSVRKKVFMALEDYNKQFRGAMNKNY